MDSPVRKQLKRNDYLRHKMFRKINRRRKAERLLAINAPAKELRRRLRRRTFKCGKDAYLDGKDKELPYPLRTSKDYDDNEAYQAGIVRDPVTGHMWSTTQEEYPKERRYLKRPGHPTFPHSVWADKNAGYDVYMRDGQFYSAPTFSELMYTKPPFVKKKPKFAPGKDEELVELPEVRVDAEGNVIADDGRKGTVRLPDITVRPTYLDLDTYYPLRSDYITGHSVLKGVKDITGGMYIDHDGGSFYISRTPSSAGYNFVTNNCSDATREALEAATGNKINPYLFTTPGDVQDFFKEQYPDFKVITEGPKTTLRAYVTPAEFDRAKAVSDSLYRADAEKYRQEALRVYREIGLNRPKFATGKDSGIHIKPENRGKFTRLKKRTGKSASWFKAHGTPAQKKMAVFALNSRKWSHKK